MKKIVSVLLGGILAGCTHFYAEDVYVEAPESGRMNFAAVQDLARNGIYDANGFVKQGNRLAVGASYLQEGVARGLDLSADGEQCLCDQPFVPGKPVRALSSFNSSDGHHVTALDFKKGELLVTPVIPLTRGNAETTVIRLPEDRQHLIAAKGDGYVVATGLYEEGRYLLYSPADGSARYYLSYPECPDYPGLQEKTKGMLYASGILRLRPDGRAFVCADMYSGVIDFCRLSDAGIERVKLVYLSYPEVAVTETPVTRVLYSRDNHFGFMDLAVTSDRIYALYSGRVYGRNGEGALGGKQLLEYDWEGNLLKNHELEVPLSKIAYDPEEELLYGLVNNTDVSLVKLEL